MASPLTRRDLFGLFRKSVEASTPLPVPLRPPGAIDEDHIADSCLRCGACEKACPRQAIKPLPEKYGDRAGTPYIVPRNAPCVLCNGLLCTTVCPSGTLRRVNEPADVRMGTARIDPKKCLPWRGQPCNRCIMSCPINNAIVMDDKTRPVVTDACTGCGVCEHYCPTEPAAIRVRPRAAT